MNTHASYCPITLTQTTLANEIQVYKVLRRPHGPYWSPFN